MRFFSSLVSSSSGVNKRERNTNREVASYPMPMAPSREFAVSMAGSGYSMHFHFLNIMHWRFSELFIVQSTHLKAARRTLEIMKPRRSRGREIFARSTYGQD